MIGWWTEFPFWISFLICALGGWLHPPKIGSHRLAKGAARKSAFSGHHASD
jgi:hypothetical protein